MSIRYSKSIMMKENRWSHSSVRMTLHPRITSKYRQPQAALDYAPYLKGLTVYRAGSKGNEPLEAIPLTLENIKNNMGEPVKTAVAVGDACSLTGGDC